MSRATDAAEVSPYLPFGRQEITNIVLSDASERICVRIIFVVQIVHSVFLVKQLANRDKFGREGADPTHSEGVVFDGASRHCYGGILNLFEISVKQEQKSELQRRLPGMSRHLENHGGSGNAA